jgi:hypothetical protein
MFLDVFEVGLVVIRSSGYFTMLQELLCLFPLWRFASGSHSDGLLLFEIGQRL